MVAPPFERGSSRTATANRAGESHRAGGALRAAARYRHRWSCAAWEPVLRQRLPRPRSSRAGPGGRRSTSTSPSRPLGHPTLAAERRRCAPSRRSRTGAAVSEVTSSWTFLRSRRSASMSASPRRTGLARSHCRRRGRDGGGCGFPGELGTQDGEVFGGRGSTPTLVWAAAQAQPPERTGSIPRGSRWPCGASPRSGSGPGVGQRG